MFPDSSPIAAIATAPGHGGIGVVRVSGSGLIRLAQAICGLQSDTLQAREAK